MKQKQKQKQSPVSGTHPAHRRILWMAVALAAVLVAAGVIVLAVTLSRGSRTLLVEASSPYGDGTLSVYQKGEAKGDAYRLILQLDGKDKVALTVTAAEGQPLQTPQISWLYGGQVMISGRGDKDYYIFTLVQQDDRLVVDWTASYDDYTTASVPEAYQVKALARDVVLAVLPETTA